MEHAKEMVDCSLSIRDYIRHFPIPHFPDEVMQIRIGVHTGGVVAGVAGVGVRPKTMPFAVFLAGRVRYARVLPHKKSAQNPKRLTEPVNRGSQICTAKNHTKPYLGHLEKERCVLYSVVYSNSVALPAVVFS